METMEGLGGDDRGSRGTTINSHPKRKRRTVTAEGRELLRDVHQEMNNLRRDKKIFVSRRF